MCPGEHRERADARARSALARADHRPRLRGIAGTGPSRQWPAVARRAHGEGHAGRAGAAQARAVGGPDGEHDPRGRDPQAQVPGRAGGHGSAGGRPHRVDRGPDHVHQRGQQDAAAGHRLRRRGQRGEDAHAGLRGDRRRASPRRGLLHHCEELAEARARPHGRSGHRGGSRRPELGDGGRHRSRDRRPRPTPSTQPGRSPGSSRSSSSSRAGSPRRRPTSSSGTDELPERLAAGGR
jgi:hypothetical protein